MGVLILSQRVSQGVLSYPPIYKNTILGRVNTENSIAIEEATDRISFEHAEIKTEGNLFFIQPIRTNIITINNKNYGGSFAQTVPLNNNDEIKIDSVILKVKIEPNLGSKPYYIFEQICINNNFPRVKPIKDSKWLQFDKANQKEFDSLAPNESLASKEIEENKKFSEKEKLKNFFKIYIQFSPAYIFSEFDKVLKAINQSEIPLVSGKVSIIDRIYTLPQGHIVLYVIGENNKNKLISKLLNANFNTRSLNYQPISYCKQENAFIFWNQGGHSMRNGAEVVGKFYEYFIGEHFHLINPEKLK